MKLGIDLILENSDLQRPLRKKNLALVAHPASVTRGLIHSLDALSQLSHLQILCGFGPQHGMKGEKQYNMVESQDYIDPYYRIPIYSLYGEVRRPRDSVLKEVDVVLFDLQDIGCRVYTYISTLLYMMEACARLQKTLWVLDRPNPAGRPIEGLRLRKGQESFVGVAPIPMRHGLTMGEMARFYQRFFKLDLDLRVIEMQGYDPSSAPGFGWPLGEFAWVNPSPNASSINMARVFPGSVMLEGTHLSEGRGTTVPLEVAGAPTLDIIKILREMRNLKASWLEGAAIRPCFFQPTFYKHQGALCQGFQVHAEGASYQHGNFKPFRLFALFFKALRRVHPEFELWREFKYEYEEGRLAIDVITGGSELREWVDSPNAAPEDLEALLTTDEQTWEEERTPYRIY